MRSGLEARGCEPPAVGNLASGPIRSEGGTLVAHSTDPSDSPGDSLNPGASARHRDRPGASLETTGVVLALAVAVLVAVSGVYVAGRNAPSGGSCASLPETSGATPFAGWLEVNASEWQESGRPVVLFYGAAGSAETAVMSWGVWGALSNFGTVRGVQFGYVGPSAPYPGLPEVIFSNATLASTTLAGIFSETPFNESSALPVPTNCAEQSYVSTYGDGTDPMVVLGGHYVDARGSELDLSQFDAYALSPGVTSTTIGAQITAQSGGAWDLFDSYILLTMALIVEEVGVPVSTLASEYGWSSAVTADVTSLLSQL